MNMRTKRRTSYSSRMVGYCPCLVRGGPRTGALPTMVGCQKPLSPCLRRRTQHLSTGWEKTSRMLGGRANAVRQLRTRSSGLMCATSSINSLNLLILPFLSVPERLDLLCRADREVALRAAARYIDLLLHHHECVHVCVYVPLSYCYRRVIDVQRVTCVTNDIVLCLF